MPLDSLRAIMSRLRRGRNARKQFVESHLNKTLAYQIRATRDRLGWSQEKLAREVGMNQNAISRLESPEYGKPTITTLKRLASAFDVALIVRFVRFSELADWVSSTPRVIPGLETQSLAVAGFDEEEAMDISGQNDLEIALRRLVTETAGKASPIDTQVLAASAVNAVPVGNEGRGLSAMPIRMPPQSETSLSAERIWIS